MTTTALTAASPLRTSAAAIIFTITIFVSASLLFFVQPLYTKLAVPQIGGAAAVWTTAMLFFQSALIGGYLYAHFSTRHLGIRAQVALHVVLMLLAMTVLPLAIPAGWAYDPARSAAIQTLGLYALGVGAPFAVLSANAPLIQSWYSRTGGPSAGDPYFLYGASNLGSLIALLAFPLVAEPLFGATAIGRGWAAGFGVLAALLLACGSLARGAAQPGIAPTAAPAEHLTLRRIARWALLAFIPSSLMLGITSKISTDLGSIPLVWVVPLSLYLLTFVLAFTAAPRITDALLARLAPVALIFLTILGTTLFNLSLSWPMAGLLTLGFFILALAAHRALFLIRPDAGNLTVFYVTMSVGGALGGVFNSIIAPVLFDDFHELPIIVAVSALVLLRPAAGRARRDLTVTAAAAAMAALPLILNAAGTLTDSQRGAVLIVVLLAAAAALRRSLRRAPEAAAIVAVIAGVALWQGRADVVLRDRSFFGAHKIVERDGMRLYYNGTTIHGAERLAETDQARPSPLFYYHKDGSLAQVMMSAKAATARSVGVVGLGVGALSCYSRPGQAWQFYEIDGAVDDIARDPQHFTFMQNCAGTAPTHLGDARVVLQRQTDARFDILVLDAYSSDAVPVHLATTEAIQMYLDRLSPDGLLVFHISNRYYDLERPLARIARDLGLVTLVRRHGEDGLPLADGDTPSIVAIMARDPKVLAEFAADPRWSPLNDDGGAAWTDDRSNLLAILR